MPPDPAGVRTAPPPGPTFPDPVPVDFGFEFGPDVGGDSETYDRSSLRGDFVVMIAGQTEGEYLRKAPEKRRCEFIDGIVYMPPSVHAVHQCDLNLLLFLITYYHFVRPIGFIATGPTQVKLRDGCVLEPDLFLVPGDARAQIRGEGFGRPPVLLVVEILSPSTRSYDLDTKAALYREAKVDEIWFVDRRDRVVLVERREGDDYVTERVAAGPVVSCSLPGFWFDAGWLWADPEPNLLDCANLVLAGPPG